MYSGIFCAVFLKAIYRLTSEFHRRIIACQLEARFLSESANRILRTFSHLQPSIELKERILIVSSFQYLVIIPSGNSWPGNFLGSP